MPKISIIVPNYNYAGFLDTRIQSIIEQTYTDLEVIILDDGSTDDSIKVIEKYKKDKRVRTKFHKQNSGSTYVRWNEGALMAKGEYLLFAGADDICDRIMIEKLLKILEAHPSVAIAHCRNHAIDEKGNIIENLNGRFDWLNKIRWKTSFCEDDGVGELYYILNYPVIETASSVVIRASNFFKTGGFDESLSLFADQDMWAKLLLHGGVGYISEPLGYYRFHGRSVRAGTTLDEAIRQSFIFIDRHIHTAPFSRREKNKIINFWVNYWIKNTSGRKIFGSKNFIENLKYASTIDRYAVLKFISRKLNNLLGNNRYGISAQ